MLQGMYPRKKAGQLKTSNCPTKGSTVKMTVETVWARALPMIHTDPWTLWFMLTDEPGFTLTLSINQASQDWEPLFVRCNVLSLIQMSNRMLWCLELEHISLGGVWAFSDINPTHYRKHHGLLVTTAGIMDEGLCGWKKEPRTEHEYSSTGEKAAKRESVCLCVCRCISTSTLDLTWCLFMDKDAQHIIQRYRMTDNARAVWNRPSYPTQFDYSRFSPRAVSSTT